MDIVTDHCGMLATQVEEYAEYIYKTLEMSEERRLALAAAGRKRVEKFSEGIFEARLLETFDSVLK